VCRLVEFRVQLSDHGKTTLKLWTLQHPELSDGHLLKESYMEEFKIRVATDLVLFIQIEYTAFSDGCILKNGKLKCETEVSM
jgi:hypothetical protein